MKYILLGFLFFLIMLFLFINYSDILQINGMTEKIDRENIPEKESFITHKSNINDTFTIEGALVSTIVQNLSSFYSNVYNNATEKQKEDLTKLVIPVNDKSNNETTLGSQSEWLQQQQQQTLFPIPKPISQNITDIETNNSESISDNLVSLLSGIIVESIHNGNPTINNETLQPDSDNKNNKDQVILVSGKWSMDVKNSNITDFNTKFVMITSDGTGFHWHSMYNLKTTEKLFLGKDDNAMINGKLEFFTGNNTTKQISDILLTINNLEFIQITILDKGISNHFDGFPIYGTIDSIQFKN